MNRDDWLSQVEEEIIEPDLPICDPHHHLWHRPDHRYLVEELLADTGSGHNVVSTVFVECMANYAPDAPERLQPLGETRFVVSEGRRAAALQGNTRVNAGIVGFADLLLGDGVEEVLEKHLELGEGAFRGIRHAAGFDQDEGVKNSHSNPPEGLFERPDFRAGFARLAPHNLSFDAWHFHHQIPSLTALARAFPDTRIVLDHFGGPLGIGPYEGRREEIFTQWRQDLAELAACPNVFAKLGGMAMPVNGYGWHHRDKPLTSVEFEQAYGDWYHHTIDVFGPERCMFESNFPVDRASISYPVLWNGLKRIAARYSKAEKAAMFHDVANEFYRL